MAGNSHGEHYSSHVDSNSESCYTRSLRQMVFGLLQKDLLLTAKDMCRELGLPYGKYGAYVNNCKSFWKSSYGSERGSKCSIHAWRGWCYVPKGVDRSQALGAGWVRSRARNRWLLWKDQLGRLQWFETSRVNLYIRKPANLGRAYQLFCNGFSFTGLITDVKVLEGILAGVRFKGAHYVFETEHRLLDLPLTCLRRATGWLSRLETPAIQARLRLQRV